MHATQQIPCNCTMCPGAACTCGCQQAAEQTAGACGQECQCGAQCHCGAGASCIQS